MNRSEVHAGKGVYVWENGALVYLTTFKDSRHAQLAEDDEEWEDDDDWEDEGEDEEWDEEDDDWDEDEDEADDDDWEDEDDPLARGYVEPIRRRAPLDEPRHEKPSRSRPRLRDRHLVELDASDEADD